MFCEDLWLYSFRLFSIFISDKRRESEELGRSGTDVQLGIWVFQDISTSVLI